MKKPLMIFSSIFVVLAVIVGGVYMEKQREKQYMIDVVQSEEVTALIEKRLKHFDRYALTEKGVIQLYEVDTESVKKNPMGGFSFNIIINNNRDLYIRPNLDRGSSTGQYKIGEVIKSPELAKLLRGANNDGLY